MLHLSSVYISYFHWFVLHFSYYHTSWTKSTSACVNCFYCLPCKIKIVLLSSYWIVRSWSDVNVPSFWKTDRFRYIYCFKTLDNLLNGDYRYFNLPEITTTMHVLLSIVMQELDCLRLVYIKSLRKSQSHETSSSMKLTGGSNVYDQSTRHVHHYSNNIHV